MEEWTNSFDIVTRIFQFFKITEMETPRVMGEGEGYACGVFEDKLLCATITLNDDEAVGIQFREKESHRDMGGAIIRDCIGIEFFERQDGNSHVIIYNSYGYVLIDKFGIHSNFGSVSRYKG